MCFWWKRGFAFSFLLWVVLAIAQSFVLLIETVLSCPHRTLMDHFGSEKEM